MARRCIFVPSRIHTCMYKPLYKTVYKFIHKTTFYNLVQRSKLCKGHQNWQLLFCLLFREMFNVSNSLLIDASIIVDFPTAITKNLNTANITLVKNCQKKKKKKKNDQEANCQEVFNPCPAEPGYTLPLQTV